GEADTLARIFEVRVLAHVGGHEQSPRRRVDGDVFDVGGPELHVFFGALAGFDLRDPTVGLLLVAGVGPEGQGPVGPDAEPATVGEIGAELGRHDHATL